MSEGDQYVGATIAGKYFIHRLIGVGGMGSVYEGQHLELGKRVAIKIIDGAAGTSAELATRFRREARAASAVESDGIVQVFDVGRDPELGLYMVMELLQGEDLEHRLRREPGRKIEPGVVALIGYQVARALVKAHASRVIHRDLKPANLFLTDRDDGSLRVKILDFGISKLLASEASSIAGKEGFLGLTAAGVALGTPQYMSPEQAQGLTTVDHRCDVWGLGVVLYEALAGIPAFPELRTYNETIINLLETQAQPLSRVAPWVPEALASVVHAAIVHNVGARIQDATAFARRLEEAMPEVMSAATGPFNSMQLARLSSTLLAADRASAPRSAPRALLKQAAAPEAPSPSNEKSERPITLGHDTQIVLRPNDLSETYESDPTMLADSARAAGYASLAREPKQAGPWVEPPNEGSGTLKTGLSLTETPTTPLVGAARQAIAAVVTAFLIVLVGGSVLLLTRRDLPAEPAGAAGAPAPLMPGLAVPPIETVAPPAPPATGTAGLPVAPATGAAVVESTPPAEKGDAAPSTAAVEPIR